jgi:hypothetical protein
LLLRYAGQPLLLAICTISPLCPRRDIITGPRAVVTRQWDRRWRLAARRMLGQQQTPRQALPRLQSQPGRCGIPASRLPRPGALDSSAHTLEGLLWPVPSPHNKGRRLSEHQIRSRLRPHPSSPVDASRPAGCPRLPAWPLARSS